MKDRPAGISCAILAGGEGSRLRAEKAMLTLGDQFLVETLGLSFFNINTPEDLERAREIYER